MADRPLRVLALDEARFGLKSGYRRRWCPCGYRPPWIVHDRYEWLWLYAAVEPDTGASCCLYLPYLDTVCFQLFIDQLSRTYAEDYLLVVMDQAAVIAAKPWYGQSIYSPYSYRRIVPS